MDTGLPLKAWEWMQPPLLLRRLPQELESWQWVVVAAAFLVLVAGHGFRLYECRNRSRAIMHEWYMTLLVLAFALITPWAATAASGLMMKTTVGPAPNDVARKCVLIAFLFPQIETVLDRRGGEEGEEPGSAEEALREEGLWGYGNSFWEQLETDVAVEKSDEEIAIATVVTQQAVGLKAWSLLGTYLLSTGAMVVAGASAWLGDLIREGAVIFLTFVLPVAIVCLRVRSLKAIGHRCILLFTGTLLWLPLWGMGHLVTGALADGYLAVYSAGEAADGGLSWDGIEDFDPSEKAGLIDRVGMAIPYEWMLMVSLSACGLLLWVVGVVFGVPWVVYRMFRWRPSGFGLPAFEDHDRLYAGRAE